MNIKKEILVNFAKDTGLANDHAIKEVKLNFAEKGLIITSVTDGNAIMVKGQIPSTSFEDYFEIGKVAILNFIEFQKVLNALKEDITITKEGNVLILKGGRKIEVVLADETSMKEISIFPKLEYASKFTMSKDFFEEITKNLVFSLNKNDSTIIHFEAKNKVLTTKYGTKYKFEDTIVVEDLKEDATVIMGLPILNALANMTGDVTIEMKTNYPMTITRKTDMYIVKVIVAPKG